jgi:hypothetical protein
VLFTYTTTTAATAAPVTGATTSGSGARSFTFTTTAGTAPMWPVEFVRVPGYWFRRRRREVPESVSRRFERVTRESLRGRKVRWRMQPSSRPGWDQLVPLRPPMFA